MTVLTSMWIAWGAAGGSGVVSVILVVLAARDLWIARSVNAYCARAGYGG